MVQFEELIQKVRTNNPEADTELLRRAYDFSAIGHKGQTRRSGEPYLSHPLEVAVLMADMKLDVVAICAGLLHDVVEDTRTSIDRIRDLFGSEIAHLVEGVTKLGTLPLASTEERQAENFRRMLLAMVDDVRVILLKLADRLHNMRTLLHLPEEHQVKIAQETIDIYAPIAYRLGMGKVRNELEELAFRYLEPMAHKTLGALVERKRLAMEGTVEQLRKTIEAKLQEAEIPVINIEGRTKRLYSIHQKLQRQRLDLEQVYDLIALRVVTPSVRGCYAALGIIHHTWSPVPGRFKDFIAMPRPNGYQSLHTSVVSGRGVPFEVQVRTEGMHHIAQEGIAAHWKYKEGRIGSSADEHYFRWLRQVLDSQQEITDPREFIHNLKIDLYPEEVYTFTPKGEVKTLPRGATVIDFAYSVHTDVGHRCVGARVNGRMVSVRSQLSNGDIIEVVTAIRHRPSRDWLNFVVTSRARNKIKCFIHTAEKIRAIELGRKLFEREARRQRLDSRALFSADVLSKAAVHFENQKADDLLAAIGYGKLGARQVLAKISSQDQLKKEPLGAGIASVVRRAFWSGGDKISVRGLEDLMVFRARCCNPIRGEKIVGYITRGRGVSVHREQCRNVVNFLYEPERRIDVIWDKSADSDPYIVQLTIQSEDRQGLLADVTSKIAGAKVNIKNVEAVTTENRRGQINLTVEISNLRHLQAALKSIRGVRGVLEVKRTTR